MVFFRGCEMVGLAEQRELSGDGVDAPAVGHWHDADGHEGVKVRRIRLADRVVGDRQAAQGELDLQEVRLVAGGEHDGACARGQAAGRALAGGVHHLRGQGAAREVGAHDHVVREGADGGAAGRAGRFCGRAGRRAAGRADGQEGAADRS